MLGRPRIVATLALLTCAPFLAACEPPPPPPTFTVDSIGTGADADPGDGTCDDGSGWCTLPAAVDEANALGAAIIDVPNAAYPHVQLEITGAVTLRGHAGEHVAGTELPEAQIDVLPGATLAITGMDLGLGILRVQGGLLADRIALMLLAVDAGGTALVRNALVMATAPMVFSPVVNEGTLHLQSSTVVSANAFAWAIMAGAEADTRVRGTAIIDDGTDACLGPITSEGYNAANDDSCLLTAAGDRPSQAGLSSSDLFPDPGHPLRDAVPVGEAGCGTEVVHDILGRPRPQDAGPEAACDIGAFEGGPFA